MEEIQKGLCSNAATRRLCDCLRAEIDDRDRRSAMWRSILTAFRHNPHSPVHWLSCLLLLLMAVLLLVASSSQQHDGRAKSLMFEGSFMLILGSINVVSGVWEEYLRQTEMTRKVSRILTDVAKALHELDKNEESLLYFPVLMPSCPSLSFIPTYRDGRLVNLPVCLLVEDDEVLMPPGSKAPVRMTQINREDGEETVVLDRGDTFQPATNRAPGENERIEHTRIMPWSRFKVTEAAATHIIRHSLAVALNRPVSVLTQEKDNFIINLLSHRLIWILLCISLLVNILRLALSSDDVSNWPEMVCILQIYTVMPLLPLSFPLLWTFLRLYGAACVLSSFNHSRSQQDNTLIESVVQDFTPPDPSPNMINGRKGGRTGVLQTFWELVKGKPDSLPRTASILEGLGNVSVLSCADKEGVLCNPSPYPNKVFFFCSKDTDEVASINGNRPSEDTIDENKCETDEQHMGFRPRKVSWHELKNSQLDELYDTVEMVQDDENGQQTSHSPVSNESWMSQDELILNVVSSSSPSPSVSHASPGSDIRVQVLDFSVMSVGGTLKFDDPSWPRFLQSLKPLGLNVLLNSASQSPLTSFWRQSHLVSLTSAPSKSSDSLERYLFTLGHEIGFTSGGLAVFQPLSSLSVFTSRTSWEWMRPSSRQGVTNNKNSNRWRSLSSHLQLSGHKASIGATPLTQVMVSQIVKQKDSAMYQLLSRGPADVLLDQCVDFWDGTAVRPLTGQERKRVMDFHRRSSLSAYCVALAYRPLHEPLVGFNQDVYITVPSSYYPNDTPETSESPETLSLSNTSLNKSDSADNEDETDFLERGPVQCVSVDPECCFRLQKGQVFIGMVSLQYQPKQDIVKLVEDLDGAGIRFIHFSSDSELKSKVFAAKMGLETGWNCHISLAEDIKQEDQQTSDGEGSLTGSTGSREDDIIEGLSQDTEFETVFMNYKARLPRGIKHVRPHLKNVDNVPLQVSLFTDCTSHATREMIEILQENGDVVCCIGSALNYENTAIFAQADISFGLEPIYPLSYSKTGSYTNSPDILNDTFVSLKQGQDFRGTSRHLPIWLACVLNSLPCSLVFHREDNVRVTSLVNEARHITMSLRLCFLFLLSCLLTLTVTIMLSSLFFLPPPLSGLHIIWQSVVIVPLLSVAILTVPAGKELMVTMTTKNREHVKDLRRFSMYYVISFVPLAAVIVLCFALTLAQLCKEIKESVWSNSSNHTCHALLGIRYLKSDWNGWGLEYAQSLALAQDINSFLLSLYFILASLTFAERNQPLQKLRPNQYKCWGICAALSMFLQIVYFAISTSAWSDAGAANTFTARLSDVPVAVYVIGLLWPLPSLAVHELVKRHDRKLYGRYQKRRKLEFQTKLGMNSPV